MMTSGSIELSDGLTVHYEECGHGQPIVFIHGMWASSQFFSRQMEALGKNYHCIAFDIRGHGRSTKTLSRLTVPCFAKDLKNFLDGKAISSPVLVGWSMGAFIIWELYKQFGRMDIRGAVIVDQAPTDLRSDSYPEGMLSFEDICNWHEQVLVDQKGLMDSVLPMMFHNVPGQQDVKWMCREMCQPPASIAANVFFDQSVRDYRDIAPEYPVPTLVCSGKYSPQSIAGARLIANSREDRQLEVFADSGHCLFWEESDRFNSLVDLFVKNLG